MKKIVVNTEKRVPVTKGMTGLFFEDINYNLDGGLNAELLENRNFEALRIYGIWDDYTSEYDGLYAWKRISDAKLTIRTEDPQNEVNPHYLHVEAGVGAGFANQAYDGIYMTEGASYNLSFWARGEVAVKARVTNGSEQAAEAIIKLSGEGWNKYTAVLTANQDVEKGRFAILFEEEGAVDFDLISVIPQDAVLGIFRKDLFEKLNDLKPGFLRFPGGCIIEGNNLANRYQWKTTIGPVETRKHNWNRWAVHGVLHQGAEQWEKPFESPYSHYGQTYAVGFYEYFLLSEALQCKPLPVLSVGLACQYQSTEMVAIDSPEFQEFIKDALDLIEFANGPVDSEWGAKRAAMGHAEPFGLDRIGIGNEQWQTEKADFYERYEAFEKAIHAVYPEMKLVGSAGPDVLTPRYEDAWKWIHEKAENNDNFVYAVDEHYYVKPEWLYDHVDFYDNYPRNVKVFAGEYAAHIPGKAGRFNSEKANSYEAALAEAAFLTGVERNADVVIMASYAPLIARVDWTQWSPDLIWFNGKKSYGTPSYYVQQMYSLYTGNESLATCTEGEDLYASCTHCDTCGKYIVKVVNHSEEAQEVEITLAGDKKVKCISMAYQMEDRNSIENPEKVVPVTGEIQAEAGKVTLAPNSFNVLIFED